MRFMVGRNGTEREVRLAADETQAANVGEQIDFEIGMMRDQGPEQRSKARYREQGGADVGSRMKPLAFVDFVSRTEGSSR
jgi:hypothetical protein